jgi:tetratricopeptide (TPR) repeat protein
VSFGKLITLFLFAATVFAQMSPAGGEMSWSGEVQSNGSTPLNTLYVELFDPRTHTVVEREPVSSDGGFRLFHGHDDPTYTIRVVETPGGNPLAEESRPAGPGSFLVMRLPFEKTNKPPSGSVSLDELQHPIPKQAIRAAVEAQRYAAAHDTTKAIAKLEEAIRIAPSFRDGHTNLGVQYAKAGRLDEAVAQFQAALAVGPPNALIYSNMSLAYLNLKQFRDGEAFARKALALEPDNAIAQRLLRYAEAH